MSNAATLDICSVNSSAALFTYFTYLEQFPYGDIPLKTHDSEILVDVVKQRLLTWVTEVK